LRRGWAAIGGRYTGGIPQQLAQRFRDAALIIFDAGEPLAFYPAVRAHNPRARLIFRMSDLPELHPGSPKALESFPRLLEDADVVAVPAESMRQRYRGRPSVRLVPHGLELSIFDRQHPSPYEGGGPHAVFVGMGRLDAETLAMAARIRPDITFHLVGPWDGQVPEAPNIVFHGTMPFERTVPFVQHADVGLHFIRADEPDSFSRSLKVVQYSYCRLPVVVPENTLASGANMMAYRDGDEASLREALDRALRFNRATFVPDVRSWDDVLADLLSAAGLPSEPSGRVSPP
jgi:2-beta-glucuronyltransferase